MRINDREIPAFTMPSPILAMTGFAEGSWYSPGYGVSFTHHAGETAYLFLRGSRPYVG